MRAATTRAANRFAEIVGAAQQVFGSKGYGRTQVSDVARELRISSGLVYHYFESKEALFHTALEQALDPDGFAAATELPVPTPEAGATLAMVREQVEGWVAAPLVEEALSRSRSDDARSELEAIVTAFYDGAERRRLGADLLERSAMERPDLAELWFAEVRRLHFEHMAAYLQSRMDAGQLRTLPDARIAARILIEIVVFFARHRHRDSSHEFDDRAVRENVVRFVLAALVP